MIHRMFISLFPRYCVSSRRPHRGLGFVGVLPALSDMSKLANNKTPEEMKLMDKKYTARARLTNLFPRATSCVCVRGIVLARSLLYSQTHAIPPCMWHVCLCCVCVEM